MRHLSLIAALALVTFGTAGTASAQIGHCDQGNPVLGTVVGAVVGGTAGGVIAGNNRGFRDGRRFNNRGFRGGHGYNRRGNFRGRRGGNQGLGVALGAIAGGIVGNQIANSRARDCNHQIIARQQVYTQQRSSFQNGHVLAGGPIDYNARRLGDPYGGQLIVDYTANQTGQAQPQQTAQPQTQRQGVFQPVCQTVERSTRLPNGRSVIEPVDYCQFSPGGEWVQR